MSASTPEKARETNPNYTPVVQTPQEESPHYVSHMGDFKWDHIPVLAYKEDGTHFKSITRQVLYQGQEELNTQLRYFEISPDGHSTLERHEHIHSVLIIRGQGQCFVDDTVYDLKQFDVVYIPSLHWHQFRANKEDHLGFLCMVNCDRDRPQRPDETQLEEIRKHEAVANFIRT